MKNRIALSLFFALFYASGLGYCKDYSEYKDKAKQFLNSKGRESTASKIDEISTEPPKSRVIDSSPKTLSEEDKRHVKVHMKLANRHFLKKDYNKAKEEVQKVFSRDPGNSGGHFMLAVIAGRQKQHEEAWYHIEIAKEKDSSNNKIDDFIAKLKTVSQKPVCKWVPGIYYGIPVCSSEKSFDILDKLLSDQCSQNITKIECSDFNNRENKTAQEITFSAIESFASDKIVSLLKNVNNNQLVTVEKSSNKLKVTLTQDTAGNNSSAKAIKNINDFINELVEDMPEVAVLPRDEAEPANGAQDITYEVSSRDFTSINKFFRQISPFALKYYIQTMDLAYIPGKQSEVIWKAIIKVTYKI